MRYGVYFGNKAIADLEVLNIYAAYIILSWIRKNLEGCSDPRIRGQHLMMEDIGHWKYRIGVYRLLVKIEKERILILSITGGADRHADSLWMLGGDRGE